MVERTKLDEDLQGTPVDPTRYHGMVVSLMHLSSSRPDFEFAICMCVRYQYCTNMQMLITPDVKILKEVPLAVYSSWVTDLSGGLQRSKKALLSQPQRLNTLPCLDDVPKFYG
ncbi:hypothetical protein Tco_0943022 [Tanacetum coccineum]